MFFKFFSSGGSLSVSLCPRATELVRAMQNGTLTPGEAQEMIKKRREEMAAQRAAADAPTDVVADIAPDAAAAAPLDETATVTEL